MARYLLILCPLFCQCVLPAQARVRGITTNVAIKNPFAKAILNLGADRTTQTFTNAFKGCSLNASPISDFLKLDLTGYPTSAPSGNLQFSCNGVLFPNTVYRLRVPQTRTVTVSFNTNPTWTYCSVISGAPSTVNCGSTTSGSFSVTSVGTGSGADTVVQFTTSSSPSISGSFPGTGTYASGTGEIALYRASDEAAYLAGVFPTTEYISEIKGAGPIACRMMGLANTNFSGEVKWAYRIQTQNFGWVATQFPPTIVNPAVGALLSGTDTYAGLAATDTPATLTAGEMYTAIVANANDGVAAPSLNIGGRGAVKILNNVGTVPAANELKANQIYTFWYDPVLQAFISNENQSGGLAGGTGGIYSGMPIEAQVQIANAANCDLYSNVPSWADDDWVANWASYVANNLKSTLNFYPEPFNESWNGAYFVNNYMQNRGIALGITTTGTTLRPAYGYHGLRFKQVINDISAVWPGGLPNARVRPVMGVATIPAFASATQSYRLEGADLNTTTLNNSTYCTFTGGTWNGSSCAGGANYSSAPNRPVDASYYEATAPYVGGTNLCTGSDVNCTLTASANGSFYQTLINNYEAGSTAAVVSQVDNDIRQGLTNTQTVTASGTTFTTPTAHGFSAGSSNVAFTVSGGTSFSGVPTYPATNQSAVYQVDTIPTSTTFTVKAYTLGVVSGSDINTGTAGTGTVSVGLAGGRSMLTSVTTMLTYAEGLADRYNGGAGGSRPSGMPPLLAIAYEANLEPNGPLLPTVCTTLGTTYPNPLTINFTANTTSGSNSLSGVSSAITAQVLQFMSLSGSGIPTGAYGQTINSTSINMGSGQNATATATAVAITATANCVTDTAQSILLWKNDPSAAQTEWDYMKQFVGTYPGAANFGTMTYSQGSAQLNNLGGGLYGFLPSLSLTQPIAPYQTYYGFGSFNNNP